MRFLFDSRTGYYSVVMSIWQAYVACTGIIFPEVPGQQPDKMTPVPAHQFDGLQRMGVEGSKNPAVLNNLKMNDFDLVLDGLTRIFHRNAEFWGNLSESVCSIRRKA